MVIGGIANLAWGMPRATFDIDVTVWAPAGSESGLIASLVAAFRALPAHPEAFALETRVLPMEVAGFRVDLILGQLPYEQQAIRRARLVDMEGVAVRVCSPEDLIVHKIISERPKDREDVRGIVSAQRDFLDRGYLDAIVRGLAADLARPDLEEFYRSCF
jgi:hypothetical protein